jgi:hypothetical protein
MIAVSNWSACPSPNCLNDSNWQDQVCLLSRPKQFTLGDLAAHIACMGISSQALGATLLTPLITQDIIDAVDEKAGKCQGDLEGI